ncbi:recombinase family protein [Bacillus cereus group sp. BY9-3LC]|nr:recombinase family protein [Bacillus cereus group sp. BY9-3LC]MDA1777490.1 recombinase family protein [Bacillus cereus group sp. BY9-3LC]
MKCVIYRRVSTDEQAEKGFSLENQKLRLESFATSQGWEVVGDYVDDGYSGKNMERPALKRMFNDVDKFDVILVYKLDRFTRSVRDLNDMMETIKEHDIAFKSATEFIDTTTATGRMILNMMGSTAQWERETISERVTDTMYKRAESGLWNGGRVPFGYKQVYRDLIIDEEESRIVKEMFDLSLSYGFLGVSLKLNERGYKTKTGCKWNRTGVRHILMNPIYCGYVRYGSQNNDTKDMVMTKIKQDGFEEIVSKEKFDECQRIFESRRKNAPKPRHGEFNYFSGIFVCPNCGRKLYGVTYQQKDKVYKYYKCAKHSQKFCEGFHISLEVLDAAFLKELNLILDDVKINSLKKIDPVSIKKEIDGISKKKERIKNLYIDEVINRDEMKEKIEELNVKEKDLYNTLSEEEQQISESVIRETFENLSHNWKQIPDEIKMYMIRSVFESIEFKVIKKARGRWHKAVIEITDYKMR